jgi:opacity protein-like surface antigen
MRNSLILGALILFVAAPARAQRGYGDSYPKAEVSGDYQYIHANPGGNNCQGGAGSVAGNLNNWFGVVGEFGGCKFTGQPAGTSAHLLNYLFGPRVTYRAYGRLEPFGHALFGGARLTASATGLGSASTNAFAMALGGGADYKLAGNFAIRLIQVEYLYTHFSGTRQNNARIEAGIVYRWGGR